VSIFIHWLVCQLAYRNVSRAVAKLKVSSGIFFGNTS